jgi:hypothetical protein
VAQPFLTSALDEGEWSALRPSRFNPKGKRPQFPLDRRLAGPQSRSGRGGVEENNFPLQVIESWPSNPYFVAILTELTRFLDPRVVHVESVVGKVARRHILFSYPPVNKHSTNAPHSAIIRSRETDTSEAAVRSGCLAPLLQTPLNLMSSRI